MNGWEFMGAHPWLTFFLAWIVGQTVISTATAIRGKFKPE